MCSLFKPQVSPRYNLGGISVWPKYNICSNVRSASKKPTLLFKSWRSRKMLNCLLSKKNHCSRYMISSCFDAKLCDPLAGDYLLHAVRRKHYWKKFNIWNHGPSDWQNPEAASGPGLTLNVPQSNFFLPQKPREARTHHCWSQSRIEFCFFGLMRWVHTGRNYHEAGLLVSTMWCPFT